MPELIFKCQYCGNNLLKQLITRKGKCPICGQGPLLYEGQVYTTKAEVKAEREKRR